MGNSGHSETRRVGTLGTGPLFSRTALSSLGTVEQPLVDDTRGRPEVAATVQGRPGFNTQGTKPGAAQVNLWSAGQTPETRHVASQV